MKAEAELRPVTHVLLENDEQPRVMGALERLAAGDPLDRYDGEILETLRQTLAETDAALQEARDREGEAWARDHGWIPGANAIPAKGKAAGAVTKPARY